MQVMEQEALEKAAAEKANQDGRAHSAAEQKRKTALLQTKRLISQLHRSDLERAVSQLNL